jgi:hypothetical protein
MRPGLWHPAGRIGCVIGHLVRPGVMQEENQPTNGLIGLFLWALRLKMEEVTLSRRSGRPGARLQAGLSGAAFGGRATGKIYPKKRRRKNEAAVNDKKKKKHAVSNCLELDGAVVERRLDGEDGQQRLGSTPEISNTGQCFSWLRLAARSSRKKAPLHALRRKAHGSTPNRVTLVPEHPLAPFRSHYQAHPRARS